MSPTPDPPTSSKPSTDDQLARAVVDGAILASGIPFSGEEREQLVVGYVQLRSAIGAMYALTDARYESPALVFRAAPKLDPW